MPEEKRLFNIQIAVQKWLKIKYLGKSFCAEIHFLQSKVDAKNESCSRYLKKLDNKSSEKFKKRRHLNKPVHLLQVSQIRFDKIF